MLKKVGAGLCSIAIITAGSIMFNSNNVAKADDTVSMEMFNALVERVTVLETQNEELNRQIEELNNKINVNTENISKNKASISNIDKKYRKYKNNNITEWQRKFMISTYGICAKGNMNYAVCWKRLEDLENHWNKRIIKSLFVWKGTIKIWKNNI